MSKIERARKRILDLRKEIKGRVRRTKADQRQPHNLWYGIAVTIAPIYRRIVKEEAYQTAFQELAREERRVYQARPGALASSPFCRFILDLKRLTGGRGDSRINRVSGYVMYAYYKGLTGQLLRQELRQIKEAGVKQFLHDRKIKRRPIKRR